jgi:hypothetical protein
MSPSQLVTRAVLAVASLGVLTLALVASPDVVLVVAVVLVALTGYAAWRPESPAVAVLVGGHVLSWVVSVPVPVVLSAWLGLLAAAVLLLVVHLAAALAASLPPAAPVPAASVRRWVSRGAVVVGVLVPVWALALLSGRRGGLGDVGLTYAAIAAVAILTLTIWLVSRQPRVRR